MRKGVSGDMLVSAFYSFMGEALRERFRDSISSACEKLGGGFGIEEVRHLELKGFSLNWNFDSCMRERGGEEVRRSLMEICDGLKSLGNSRELAVNIFDDLIRAEAEVHATDVKEVHLHELGRPEAVMNIASFALCTNLLDLSEKRIIGSYISIGDGEVKTEHGVLPIPPPATANLLRGMRFRFGPCDGEMATPSGVAMSRNILNDQLDELPDAGREGAGFGMKKFEGNRGFVRLFEAGVEEVHLCPR